MRVINKGRPSVEYVWCTQWEAEWVGGWLTYDNNNNRAAAADDDKKFAKE
jgi:hypothetical protein